MNPKKCQRAISMARRKRRNQSRGAVPQMASVRAEPRVMRARGRRWVTRYWRQRVTSPR